MLGVKKKFDHEEKKIETPHPRIKWSAPNGSIL